MRVAPILAWSAVTLLGLILCFTPLFNLIGYESAAAVGVVVGLASAALTLHALHRGDLPAPTAARRGGSPAADFCWLLPRTVSLVVPPLVLLGLNALRVKNCDPAMGGEFWLLIPVVSAVVGQGLAWGAAALTPATWARVVLVLGVLAGDLAWFLYRLATQPPITGHSLLFGWFAGSIYDEDLSVPAHLWWYRLACLGAVACVVMATELAWRRAAGLRLRAAAWGLLAFAAPTLFVVVTHEDRGIALEREDIVERLGASVQTDHFVIHYDPAEFRGEQLALLVEDHEFRYAELQAWMGTDPVARRGRRIHSFVYPNRKVQARLMGSRGTLVARPWTHEMHIRWQHYTEGALAHELAHLFTAPFGGGPFEIATRGGVLPDIGMLEGIAMAADWPPAELSPHEAAAAMRQLEIAPDIRHVFTPTGFWSQPSGKAYTLMGSFVRWLVEEQGIEPFQRVYATGDWQGVYGRSAVDLVGEWEAFVDAISVSDSKLELARYKYKRQSIFGKTCARTVADLKRQAWAAKARGDFQAALDLWGQIRPFEQNKREVPQPGLEEVELLDRLERRDEAREILDQLLQREGKQRLRPANRARVLEQKGDLLWRGDDRAGATEAYAEALSLGVPDGARRQLEVKLHALADDHPERRALARDYMLETDGARSALYEALSWANLAPEDPVPRYLVGVQLHHAGEHAAAVETLAGPPGLLPTAHLDEQRRRLLVEDLFELRRLDEADATLDTMDGSQSSRQQAFVDEYRARVAWMRTQVGAQPGGE